MATLTVKNVGPIREAEFEVKKYTVFIGPQGSGKSTLAKLIAIGGDGKLMEPTGKDVKSLVTKFTLDTFIDNKISHWNYEENYYNISYDHDLKFAFTKAGQDIVDKFLIIYTEQIENYSQVLSIEEFRNSIEWDGNGRPIYSGNKMAYSSNFYQQILPQVLGCNSILIPTERHLFPLLSDSIWSLISSNITLPESVKGFGTEFERSRNQLSQLQIPFLGIRYSHESGRDFVYYDADNAVPLANSASGYQAVIPLLVTVEHQRQASQRRFIIEEPELNLYPTAQKDLIYNLVSGLDPEKTYQDAEWVFTTHSPYVLSSFNTLMLAYKVGHQSEENRAKVEALIPARHWINPDDFSAYYVGGGTVRSIISDTTGLISESELDDVSEDLAGEQDQLLDLYRTSLHA